MTTRRARKNRPGPPISSRVDWPRAWLWRVRLGIDGHIVLPFYRHLETSTLIFSSLTREPLELAKEYELTLLFPDCAVGAVPVLGSAYGLRTIVDESIKSRWDDVFFEAGDHEELIRVSSDQFRRLMTDAQCASFSHSTLSLAAVH